MALDRIVVVLPATATLIDSSRELLVAASRLPGEVSVLWFNGELNEEVRQELGKYQVRQVHVVELPFAVPRGVAACQAVLTLEPTWVVLRAHPDATENCALLGHALQVAAIVDCNGLTVDANGVRVHKAAFGSRWRMELRIENGGALAFRPNSFPTEPLTTAGEPPQVHLMPTPSVTGAARIESRTQVPPSGRPDLDAARVVVVGGRGTDGDFGAITELADELGGAVGATRDVTDLNWAPHETLIGQTGVTVCPQLYIGAGVSGAVHHLVGMRGAHTIVAINLDPDAPIFEVAHFGIVADAQATLSDIVAEIRKRKTASA